MMKTQAKKPQPVYATACQKLVVNRNSSGFAIYQHFTFRKRIPVFVVRNNAVRAKGIPDDGLQVVFQSVIVGKLLYASCAWSGFVFQVFESTRSCSAVNGAATVRRICRSSTNYWKMQTQLYLNKKPSSR